jgi:hypothetical protein
MAVPDLGGQENAGGVQGGVRGRSIPVCVLDPVQVFRIRREYTISIGEALEEMLLEELRVVVIDSITLAHIIEDEHAQASLSKLAFAPLYII